MEGCQSLSRGNWCFPWKTILFELWFIRSSILGPVHTYPDIFDNASFFYPFWVCVHTETVFSVTKTNLFENALQSRCFWKRRFHVVVWTGENRAFRKRWHHSIDLRRIRACARIFGDHTRTFWLFVFFCQSSNSGVWMQQRLRVDGDMLDNAPRADADIYLYGWKKMRFQKYPDTCGRGLRQQ